MYYYNEIFYNELDDLIDDLDFENHPDELSDDFEIVYQECELQPIFKLDVEKIAEILTDCFEDRFSEDNLGNENELLRKALKQSVDFEKLNSLLPEFWYPKREILKLTKSEIMEIINR